jgi:hypothetical protein
MGHVCRIRRADTDFRILGRGRRRVLADRGRDARLIIDGVFHIWMHGDRSRFPNSAPRRSASASTAKAKGAAKETKRPARQRKAG